MEGGAEYISYSCFLRCKNVQQASTTKGERVTQKVIQYNKCVPRVMFSLTNMHAAVRTQIYFAADIRMTGFSAGLHYYYYCNQHL